MSRNAAPSLNQLEKLVNFLESNPWLAMGHARTANARNRSRQAWSEITTALNSEGGGCTKTWEQWCKYWKDKKGAVKRKTSLIAAARRRTGGGIEDVPELSEIELKIQTIMGGESFGSGDRNLAINPFEEQPIDRVAESEESPSILLVSIFISLMSYWLFYYKYEIVSTFYFQNIDLPIEQQHADQSRLSEPGYEVLWSNLPAFDGNSVQDNLAPIPSTSASQPVIEPASDAHRSEAEENRVLPTEPTRPMLQRNDVLERGSQTPSQRLPRETLHSRRRTHQQSPRQSAARRRLLRRSPPAQRRSEMVSITERFIAIEERRADAELLIAQAINKQAQNSQATVEVLGQVGQAMVQALDKLGSALRDLANK
ncbi:uncharacterized protein LOC118274116 isoform X1 [Spodoptera frugiperda]|uniref:Regulatory protein zeste n=1 Tax=Spodoptera frugiperda TaxID=7108 RepID=A0A9R0EWX8_SPOFR|nr:uncharacterized protein LOC118274116 isoform X1 [Spodoptera frugiperda]